MRYVLVISSFVSASQVGGNVSAYCLAMAGLTPVLLPTTVLGRHPGWGDPGGGPVKIAQLKSMWDAIKAQNLTFDAVLTGYMATSEQIALTAEIIETVRADNPAVRILVDPVMGDDGRLYVSEKVAQKITDALVPRADIITPNLFEFSTITGRIPGSAIDVLNQCADKKGVWVVTSMSDNGLSGAVLSRDGGRYKIKHPLLASAPNGSGDCLAALFLARSLAGDSDKAAFTHAVSAVFAILSEAERSGAKELPLIDFQALLIDPPRLTIETL